MGVDRQKLRAAFSAVLMGKDLEAGAVRSALRSAAEREVTRRGLSAPRSTVELDPELRALVVARAREWLTTYLRRFEMLSSTRYQHVEELVARLDALEQGQASGFDVAARLRALHGEVIAVDPHATAICEEIPELDARERDQLKVRLDEAAERGDPTVAALTALLETVVDVLTEPAPEPEMPVEPDTEPAAEVSS